jgi:hypothetical protein
MFRAALMAAALLAAGLVSSSASAQDPAAAAADVFAAHCARCHQEGSLVGRDKPAGGFGYILDLEALARNPEYVQVGNPSASQIYTRVVNQSMPKDLDYVTVFGPSADETKAIAGWIESLGMEMGAVAEARPFIDDTTVLRAIGDDLTSLSDFDRPRTRYFTLTHLYNSGDSDAEMEVYRQALAKLLNSLSTEPALVVPVAVDEARTIFRVDITALGWTDHTWEMIEAANPYFIEYDTPVMGYLQTETDSRVPMVRADWFAYVATQPPLYYDILGLPETKAGLEDFLGIDVLRNRADLRIARAGFQQSGVSRNNRMIERHSLSTGAFWESFDFSGNAERQSFFLFPLGPQNSFGAYSDEFGFVHDGGEIIFSLPNGLQGYFLTDGHGSRLTTGPTTIVQDPSRRDQAVTNGISCMSCHDRGMQIKEDQVRDYVLGNVALPSEVRDVVAEIFPPAEEMAALMQADLERFVGALEEAGVDPNLRLSGEEIVSSLFLRFERDLTMQQAAAELGMQVEEFSERLNMGSADTYALKQRLEFNLVPRDQFVELFAELVNEISDHHAVDLRAEEFASYETPPPISHPESSRRFDLALYPNESEFYVGDEVTFSIEAELDCYLTLFNVDEQGRSTVLFPNGFNQNNFIRARTTYAIPGPEIGGFRLIFQDPGRETVIAKCNATGNNFYGIEHDFAAEAYTTFDYDEYVGRSLATRQIIVAESREPTAPPAEAVADVIAEQGVVLNVAP